MQRKTLPGVLPDWGASSDLQQLQMDKQIISIPQDTLQNLYNFKASWEEKFYEALRQGTQRCCEMPKGFLSGQNKGYVLMEEKYLR